ncbi:MAG: NAD-dependent epimerase/dehydratase family protein [Pseudomonadales bacterium]|nr:NAD-dependent epimerase/dehydratase family protein [Pseudomonadales bacterium]
MSSDYTPETGSPVLVTGGNGYIASWLVKKLLDRGFDVHATVRNPQDNHKVGHLLKMAESAKGKLTLFKADLLDPGSFDEAMAGCKLVFHTASPFISRHIKDPKSQLIDPAKLGTENVLQAANRTESVERVVLTSSVAAIYGDARDMMDQGKSCFTEQDWNTTSTETHQPYCYSKLVAEKLAWEINQQQDRWKLVVINPGLVFGPALSNSTQSESISVLKDFGSGIMLTGAPKLEFGVVDVRDVAEAHVLAGIKAEASGRHILVSTSKTYLQLAKILRSKFGSKYPFPRNQLPKFMVLLSAPFLGLDKGFVRNNMGYSLAFDNSYSKQDLGMEYTPIETTITEHFEQQLNDGIVKRR